MAFIGSVPYSESLFAGVVVIAAPRALPIIQLEANRLQLLATDAPRRLRSLGSLLLARRDKLQFLPLSLASEIRALALVAVVMLATVQARPIPWVEAICTHAMTLRTPTLWPDTPTVTPPDTPTPRP